MNRVLRTIGIALIVLATIGIDGQPVHGGRIGGPTSSVAFVPAYGSIYIDVPFTAGELATVTVAGEGNSNLELYFYDTDGHISPALGSGDRKLATMYVYRAGFFVLEIRNRGPWDTYVLITTN
jgi:hypothetical protein